MFAKLLNSIFHFLGVDSCYGSGYATCLLLVQIHSKLCSTSYILVNNR